MSEVKENNFEIPVTVEFEDVDSYSIAHHTKLIAYLERARVRYFSEIGLDILRKDVHLVLHNLDMRFIRTSKMLDRLTVSVFLELLDETRLVLGYKIKKDRKLIARATTELVCLDPETQKITPIPEEFSSKLKK